MEATDVIEFWFAELGAQDWFRKDDRIDRMIVQRFRAVYLAAAAGELWSWRAVALGALAEIIVLDQFPRNMFRDNPRAFGTDPMALVLAQEALRRSLDRDLSAPQKSFMYMPFMHSESKLIHDKAIILFAQPGLEENLKFELEHKAIIERFGRYPHRNRILGRISTPDEAEFLKTATGF